MDEPRVTTVVMTRDHWPDLARTLPRHDGPVVLVDNGSTDGTPDLVRRNFPHVTVLEMGRDLGAAARNVGVEHASTPYVAFADDDSWWEWGALHRAADILAEHPRLAVLAARIMVDDSGTDPACALMAHSPLPDDLLGSDLPGRPVLRFVARGAVVRRDAFLEVGGFDDVVFLVGEEERVALDLAERGWQLAYVSSVVARYVPPVDRDRAARRRLAARNRVLTACMRRRWPGVGGVLRDAVRTDDGRRGLVDAVPLLSAALRRRDPVSRRIEAALRLLE